MPPASTTPNPNHNLTPCTTPNSATSSNSATPNPVSANTSSTAANAQQIGYNCKKCHQGFPRYYEMIKHQKNSCFKDENPVAVNAKGLSKQSEDLNNSLSSNDFVNASNSSNNQAVPIQNGTFQCDKCSMSFNRMDLFNEHRMAHDLMGSALFANLQNSNGSNSNNNHADGPFNSLLGANLEALAAQLQSQAANSSAAGRSPSAGQMFGNNRATSPIPQHQQLLLQHQILQQLQLQQQQQQQQAQQQQAQHQQQQQANQLNKRKYANEDDDEDSQSGGDGSQCSGNGSRSTQNAKDKRLRTTILPEQLDFLYQKYNMESNPSRKMLESISEEVGLTKRVVQVWFQNARARSRKVSIVLFSKFYHRTQSQKTNQDLTKNLKIISDHRTN